MWHDLIHGFKIANEGATEPLNTSVALEFQVMPTAGWPQCYMIVFIFAGTWVPWP
jgi:hypothetical protein